MSRHSTSICLANFRSGCDSISTVEFDIEISTNAIRYDMLRCACRLLAFKYKTVSVLWMYRIPLVWDRDKIESTWRSIHVDVLHCTAMWWFHMFVCAKEKPAKLQRNEDWIRILWNQSKCNMMMKTGKRRTRNRRHQHLWFWSTRRTDKLVLVFLVLLLLQHRFAILTGCSVGYDLANGERDNRCEWYATSRSVSSKHLCNSNECVDRLPYRLLLTQQYRLRELRQQRWHDTQPYTRSLAAITC